MREFDMLRRWPWLWQAGEMALSALTFGLVSAALAAGYTPATRADPARIRPYHPLFLVSCALLIALQQGRCIRDRSSQALLVPCSERVWQPLEMY